MAHGPMPIALSVAALRAGSALILASPIASTIWARYSALHADPTTAAQSWLSSRRTARAVRLIVIVLWWMAWDLQNADFFASPTQLLLFSLPPILSVGIAQSIAYFTSRRVLRLKWRPSDIARSFWRRRFRGKCTLALRRGTPISSTAVREAPRPGISAIQENVGTN